MKMKIILGSLSLIGIMCACSEEKDQNIKTEKTIEIKEGKVQVVKDIPVEIIEDKAEVIPPVVPMPEAPILPGPPNPDEHMPPILKVEELPQMNLEKMFGFLEVPFQKQTINNNKDEVLTFEQGTVLRIKANSFVTEAGNPVASSSVELSVGEYYEVGDLLASNLNTQTEDKILETGGTIYIEARSMGEKCKLKDGASINIEFPTDEKLNNMKLFQGEWVDDKIVWEPDYDAPEEAAILGGIYGGEAQFPGGVGEMQMFIARHTYYPNKAIENNEQGRVYVSFEVGVEGELENIKVEKGVSPSLDREAIWLVNRMPRWIPAEYDGVKHRTKVRLPITFSLDDSDPRNRDASNNESIRKQFEEKVSGTEPKKVRTDEISNYILTASNLGWINCDKFYNAPGEKVNVYVNSEPNENIDVKMVFNNRRSVVQGSFTNGKHWFNRIPVGELVTIVAVKVLNNQNYFAVKQTRVQSYGIGKLEYKKCTLQELKLAMAELKWK